MRHRECPKGVLRRLNFSALLLERKDFLKHCQATATGLVSGPEQAEVIKMSRLMIHPKNKFRKIVKEAEWAWLPYAPFHVLFFFLRAKIFSLKMI